MSVLKVVLWMLLFVSINSGCAVEKRHYLNGWHVEWHTAELNKSIVQATDEDDARQSDMASMVVSDTSGVVVINRIVKQANAATSQDDGKGSRVLFQFIKHDRNEEAFQHEQSELKDAVVKNATEDTRGEVNKKAKQSSNFATLSWELFFLNVFAVIANTNPFIISLVALAALVFAIIAIIKGQVAMAEITADPNKYSNANQAKNGIVFGSAYVILVAIALFLFVIL
ncbi:MAG: hypothetical protein ACKVOR_09635 [Flavobacteriales bacterium]